MKVTAAGCAKRVARLQKEINYWDHRAEELRAQEQAGRTPRLNSAKARQRADDLDPPAVHPGLDEIQLVKYM